MKFKADQAGDYEITFNPGSGEDEGLACMTCDKEFKPGDKVLVKDAPGTPAGQVWYCSDECWKKTPAGQDPDRKVTSGEKQVMKSGLKLRAEVSLDQEPDNLPEGYLKLSGVEDPGSSAPGGMNVQDWVIYREQWLSASKLLPEGGVEGEASFIQEHPGEEYPGDVVYDNGFIYVWKGAAGPVNVANQVVKDLENYPILDDGLHSELEDEALEEELDSWALDDAKSQFGYDKYWANEMTDEEAAWLAQHAEANPAAHEALEKALDAIFELEGDRESTFRMAVREGLTYGDWTVVHKEPMDKFLKREAPELLDPVATMHQFLKQEMVNSAPGSEVQMKELEKQGQQRLFESLRLASQTVVGGFEIRAMLASQKTVKAALEAAAPLARLVGGHEPTEAYGSAFFTYATKGRLMAASVTAFPEQTFGVAWAPLDVLGKAAKAASILAGVVMKSFEAKTAASDVAAALMTTASFDVFNVTDGIYAFGWSFNTEEDAKKAIEELREGWRMQGYYKTADGERIAPEAVEFEIEENAMGTVEAAAAKTTIGGHVRAQRLTFKAWRRRQGYHVHAGHRVLSAASRERMAFWAKGPKGYEPIIKELKKSGSVDNPWAVAWSMKNRGIRPKARKVMAIGNENIPGYEPKEDEPEGVFSVEDVDDAESPGIFVDEDGEHEVTEVAGWWHGGQFTELYKLSSSGTFDSVDGLVAEIKSNIKDGEDGEGNGLNFLLDWAEALRKTKESKS